MTFKLSEWRGEVFGGGVYPESKVKEFIKLLKEDLPPCVMITLEGKEILYFPHQIIDKLSGLNEGDN